MTRSIVAVAALAMPHAAWACGGFFCNNSAPVEQTGEDIFFYVDEAAGTVTAHVQIQYQGPSEDFAWVVPVAAVPDLSVGTDTLFAVLADRLRPQFVLEQRKDGICRAESRSYDDALQGGVASTFTSASSSAGYDNGVHVIDEVAVGPYDAVTLQADSTAALLTWLGDNGYDLPAVLDPVLAPYVAGGQYFVAIKLQKDKEVGDIAPLVMTYPGTLVSIPIQLTSIAATPDMRLRVNVLGARRAVPESYLHLEINPFAIDWWQGGDNYDQVVTRAAREAGGHGFATDYAGEPPPIDGVYNPSWEQAPLATSDAVQFLSLLANYAFPADTTMLAILEEHIPLPPGLASQGVTAVDVYNCPDCYATELLAQPFDAAAAAADVEALIVAPRRELTEMFARATYATRLTSSMSPADMTVDPVFSFNGDMGDVPLVRKAVQTLECRKTKYTTEVPSRLTIGDFPDLRLPSQVWLDDHGLTPHEYILTLHEPSNALIRATAASGPGEPIQDNRPEIEANILAFNDAHRAETGAGCGCAHGTGGFGAAALLAPLALLRRRRPAATASSS